MTDIEFKSKTFPVKRRTGYRLRNLKQVVYKMRTNVDSFSLLVFLNAGREGASLTLHAPRTDSLSQSLLKASLSRPDPQSLLEPPSLGSHSSSPISGSRPFIIGTNLLGDNSFLSKEAVCLSASDFCATRSVAGVELSPFADNES